MDRRSRLSVQDFGPFTLTLLALFDDLAAFLAALLLHKRIGQGRSAVKRLKHLSPLCVILGSVGLVGRGVCGIMVSSAMESRVELPRGQIEQHDSAPLLYRTGYLAGPPNWESFLKPRDSCRLPVLNGAGGGA